MFIRRNLFFDFPAHNYPFILKMAIWLLLLGFSHTVPGLANAQSIGNAGSVTGSIVDPTGAVVPDVTVEISNPVTQYVRTTTSDNAGRFNFANVPNNRYHLTASRSGFATYSQDVDVRSNVPIALNVSLGLSGSQTTVHV